MTGRKAPEGLHESCEAFIGSLLQVVPFHALGWSGNEEQPCPPLPFRMRLLRIWSFKGVRRGGVARIEEHGHMYDGWSVVFASPSSVVCDFTSHRAPYTITLTKNELVEKHGCPVPKTLKGCPSGHADIVTCPDSHSAQTEEKVS